MSVENLISLKNEAEVAAIHVERAQLGIDHAKHVLESARTGLELARGQKVTAEAVLDDVLVRGEPLGVSKKALRALIERSIEDMRGLGLINLTALTADDTAGATEVAEATPRVKATRVSRVRPIAVSEADLSSDLETPAPVEVPLISEAEVAEVVYELEVLVLNAPAGFSEAETATTEVLADHAEHVQVTATELAAAEPPLVLVADEDAHTEIAEAPVVHEAASHAVEAVLPAEEAIIAPTEPEAAAPTRSRPPAFLNRPRPPVAGF